MSVDEKIIDKIRKLAALSKSSNEHEAALAAARMQELLFKYNIELSEIETRDQRDDYERSDYQVGRDTWRHQLFQAICRNNWCQGIKSRESGKSIIVGRRHNVEVAEFMFDYLSRELERLAERGWLRQLGADVLGDDTRKRSARTWKNNFYFGAVEVIARRLEEQLRQDATASPEAGALVEVTGRELVAATRRHVGKVSSTHHRFSSDHDGYGAGRRAGEQIGLRRGIKGGGANPGGRQLLPPSS